MTDTIHVRKRLASAWATEVHQHDQYAGKRYQCRHGRQEYTNMTDMIHVRKRLASAWATGVHQHDQYMGEGGQRRHGRQECASRSALSRCMARTKQTARKSASGVAKPAQLAGRKRPRTTSCGSATPSSLSSLSPLSSPPPSPVLQEITYLERQNRFRLLTVTQSSATFAMTELEDILGSPEISFTCPASHEKEERVAQSKLMPYFVSFFPSIPARANMPRGLYMNEARKSMNARGSLLRVLNTALEEYHKIGIDTFEHKIIFVSVHSEVTRGDLFAGKDGNDGNVAVLPKEFMEHLFSGRLRCFINGSTIFMLSCGPLVAFPESISSLKEAIVHLKPIYTVAFSAERFISAIAKSFIIAFGVHVLVQGHDLYEVFNDLLDVSVELRMHSDTLLFYVGERTVPGPPHSPPSPSVIGVRCSSIRPWSESKASLGNTVKKARVSSYVVIKGGSRDSTGQGWIKHVGI
ncbi:hypothetical protein EDD15DRAFT_2196375 [Pisolithus albus]|nr:hypothetical protein EDD15DRAFT_2196375 [Pisolithus albus]